VGYFIHHAVNRRTVGFALAALAAGTGCQVHNYPSPLGPRYAGVVSPASSSTTLASGPYAFRVVTFNVQYAQHVDRAIALIESSAALRNADIIALQEMDAAGTQRIARALVMAYVYYPASVAPATGRDFGNAILSRWPIVADAKVVLPHFARHRGSERIATAATISVGGIALRVYSVHLATKAEIGPGARRDQARAILADAAPYSRVVVSGDMNSRGIGEEFRAAGYLWPTEHDPRTHLLFNWDHIFFRGVAAQDSAPAGVVRDTLGASDHRPVWAVGVLRATPHETTSAP
jgi:endonuclease/exonuclease/phosphatase family metal-dependent hydrolase